MTSLRPHDRGHADPESRTIHITLTSPGSLMFARHFGSRRKYSARRRFVAIPVYLTNEKKLAIISILDRNLRAAFLYNVTLKKKLGPLKNHPPRAQEAAETAHRS